jgi:ERCC4-type nuclease
MTFTIITDTREKRPYKWDNSIVGTLKTGDYTVQGYESQVAIERKSKADAYGSIGGGRKRFEREFERLSGYEYAVLVIECTYRDFLITPIHSKLNSKVAINTLYSWSIKYGVNIWFADNREYGKKLVYGLLEMFWRIKENEKKRSSDK